jgi:glycogen phosphorylase
LLYRQGYFFQRIDNDGNQIATYTDSDFDDLPVHPAMREDGSEVHVQIELPGRTLEVKVWEAHRPCPLCLLDTDLPATAWKIVTSRTSFTAATSTPGSSRKSCSASAACARLQELGIKPTAYHINEGHAAFLVLERVRRKVKGGLSFHAALEAVAANTVFTTHTPVPAGHDHFAKKWCGIISAAAATISASAASS